MNKPPRKPNSSRQNRSRTNIHNSYNTYHFGSEALDISHIDHRDNSDYVRRPKAKKRVVKNKPVQKRKPNVKHNVKPRQRKQSNTNRTSVKKNNLSLARRIKNTINSSTLLGHHEKTIELEGKKITFEQSPVRTSKIKKSTYFLMLFAIFAAIGVLVYMSDTVRMSTELSNLKSDLYTLEKYKAELTKTAAATENLELIRQDAITKLDMNEPTSNQIVYLNVPKSNYVEYSNVDTNTSFLDWMFN